MERDSWRRLIGASLELPYYPWIFQAPNGKVFYAGHAKATYYLDTQGNGAWTFVANSNYGEREFGSAVMYEPGKVLIVGGGGFLAARFPTNTAETIDLTEPIAGMEEHRLDGVQAAACQRDHAPDRRRPRHRRHCRAGHERRARLGAPGGDLDPATGTWKTLAAERDRPHLPLDGDSSSGCTGSRRGIGRAGHQHRRVRRGDLLAALLVQG